MNIKSPSSTVASISAGAWATVGPAYQTSIDNSTARDIRGALLPTVTLPSWSQTVTICNGNPESVLGAGATKVLYVNTFGGTASTGTLTMTDVGIATETVVINGRTYTLVASAGATADDVTIGATATATIANLRNAINANGLGGYGTNTTVNTDVWASASGAVLTITARVGGVAGDAITTTETLTDGSWGGATLGGGVDPTAAQKVAGIPVTLNTPLTFSYDGDSVPTLYVHCAQAVDFTVFFHGGI